MTLKIHNSVLDHLGATHFLHFATLLWVTILFWITSAQPIFYTSRPFFGSRPLFYHCSNTCLQLHFHFLWTTALLWSKITALRFSFCTVSRRDTQHQQNTYLLNLLAHPYAAFPPLDALDDWNLILTAKFTFIMTSQLCSRHVFRLPKMHAYSHV